jgi:hypothetical protein
MIRVPPEITFAKRVLPNGSWSYEFRHRTLGTLGRILLRDLLESRSTHLSYEVAGDPADPMTARHVEQIAGPYPDPWPSAPPRPVEPVHGVAGELMPCRKCGAFVAMLIFAPDAAETGRFEDYARLMYSEYVRHNLPAWIIGPALGPGPEDPADILKVWPTRRPLQRLTPRQFTPRLDQLAARHCR